MLTPTVWILFIWLCNNAKGLQNVKVKDAFLLQAGLFKVCMLVWLHGFITHFMIITSHSSSENRECQGQLTYRKLSDILVSSLSGLERWFRHAPQGLNFCRHNPGKLQSDRLILSMPVHEHESPGDVWLRLWKNAEQVLVYWSHDESCVLPSARSEVDFLLLRATRERANLPYVSIWFHQCYLEYVCKIWHSLKVERCSVPIAPLH